VRIKGTAVRSVLEGIEAAYGANALARVKAALPPAVRAEIEPSVLASKEYGVAVNAALHDAVSEVLGAGSIAANRRVGAEAARIDFRGVYSVFLRVADYETLLRRLDRAFRQYNSQGHVTWEEIRPGRAQGRIDGVEGFTEPMWQAIAGRLEALLVLAGAKRATTTVESWSSKHCAFLARWTP
jgi:hypothetical protein